MDYYLLLYKIKQSPFFWIVTRDLYYDCLLRRIDKLWELEEYSSNIDEYWIIKQKNCSRHVIDQIDYLSQFTIFKPDKNSEILFQSV